MLRWTQQTCFAPCSLAPSDLVPVQDTAIGNERQASTNFEVKAATVNIQGLQDRAPYLEAQFAEQGFNVICLQETKAPAGVCHSKLFMRLTTAPERHFGVSIWISKQLGIATSRGKPILVQESDLQIRYESPRLLIQRKSLDFALSFFQHTARTWDNVKLRQLSCRLSKRG